ARGLLRLPGRIPLVPTGDHLRPQIRLGAGRRVGQRTEQLQLRAGRDRAGARVASAPRRGAAPAGALGGDRQAPDGGALVPGSPPEGEDSLARDIRKRVAASLVYFPTRDRIPLALVDDKLSNDAFLIELRNFVASARTGKQGEHPRSKLNEKA